MCIRSSKMEIRDIRESFLLHDDKCTTRCVEARKQGGATPVVVGLNLFTDSTECGWSAFCQGLAVWKFLELSK